MSTIGWIARWCAIAIAVAAVIDPAIPVPRAERPVLRVVADAPGEHDAGAARLAAAGFTIDPARRESATVLVTDRVPPDPAPGATWIVDATPAAPNVRVSHAATSTLRLPRQALDIAVVVHGEGVAGRTTELVAEDHGIPVATARHEWSSDRERWDAHLQYLPPAPGADRLSVRASAVQGETSTADNAADVALPPARGPVRVLVVEAAVTWPALFVRRALEGQGTFSIAAVQRAAKTVTTRAGGPPPALTRGALAPYEVVLAGGPEQMPPSDLEVLRWFVEARGGVLLLVPDQQPGAGVRSLTGIDAFDARVVESPLRLSGGLVATEIAVPRGAPSSATVLSADPEGHPVVVSIRRGAGAVVVSGALDAWRNRGQDDEAFARFWRSAIASAALTVPAPLEVTADPAIAQPGQPVAVSARVRDIDLSPGAERVAVDSVQARAIDPDGKTDESIRLWPTAEPGVFRGDWRPQSPGRYDVSVSAGALRGDATIVVAADVASPAAGDSEDLALLARASGGRSFRAPQMLELTAALKSAYPATRGVRRVRLMRSAWWCVPFASLLCVEWALRRRRGES